MANTKNRMKQSKILVLGAYGGNNVGDDAQLAGALDDLRGALPSAAITVLAPDLAQTARRHNISSVGYAPRVSFFDFDLDHLRYTRFERPAHTAWLIARAEQVRQEAKNYATGKPHKLTAKQLTLVREIETARMIYFVGGGYMMGPTGSRLWDAMLVCSIAKLFETPVVMSGQNIGVWTRDYDRKCGVEGFSSVALIGTRDDTFSKKALEEIKVTGNHIFATHDDAFFIPSAPAATIAYILPKVGLSKDADFISLSLHLEAGGVSIIKAIREISDLPIVIVPTCPPDQKPQAKIYEDAIAEGVARLFIVKKLHNHNEVKGIISRAYACVSSRHHPLIFAMSEAVPCLSLNFSPYFIAKNYGALKLCGIGDFCIDIADKNVSEDRVLAIKEKLQRMFTDRSEISKTIRGSHATLKAAKARFMAKTKAVWNQSEEARPPSLVHRLLRAVGR